MTLLYFKTVIEICNCMNKSIFPEIITYVCDNHTFSKGVIN